jgi:hypothetical protein
MGSIWYWLFILRGVVVNVWEFVLGGNCVMYEYLVFCDCFLDTIFFMFEKCFFVFVKYCRFLPKRFNLALKWIFDYVAIWLLLSRDGFRVT